MDETYRALYVMYTQGAISWVEYVIALTNLHAYEHVDDIRTRLTN